MIECVDHFGTEALRRGALEAQRAAEENWRISKIVSAFLARLRGFCVRALRLERAAAQRARES